MQRLGVGVKEVAASLNVSEKTVRRQIDDGKLRAFRIGDRVLVDVVSLQIAVDKVTRGDTGV